MGSCLGSVSTFYVENGIQRGLCVQGAVAPVPWLTRGQDMAQPWVRGRSCHGDCEPVGPVPHPVPH